MSDIWTRIDPENNDRLDMHLVSAAITLFATGDFSGPQIVSGLNSRLETPLTAGEQSDLSTLEAWVTALAGLDQKLVRLATLNAFLIAVERALVSETTFDNKFGL